jgi:hypothetical protein
MKQKQPFLGWLCPTWSLWSWRKASESSLRHQCQSLRKLRLRLLLRSLRAAVIAAAVSGGIAAAAVTMSHLTAVTRTATGGTETLAADATGAESARAAVAAAGGAHHAMMSPMSADADAAAAEKERAAASALGATAAALSSSGSAAVAAVRERKIEIAECRRHRGGSTLQTLR